MHDYKRNLYFIFIVKIKQYNFIFEKLLINKYEVVLDMFKNKFYFFLNVVIMMIIKYQHQKIFRFCRLFHLLLLHDLLDLLLKMIRTRIISI